MFKILKSMFTIVAVAAIAAGSTSAYFDDSVAIPGNSFASGTLDLQVNGSDTPSAIFNLSGLAPGNDISQGVFSVSNVGTLNGHHLNLTVTIDNDNDLAKNINFDATGNGLRFGASTSGSDSENLTDRSCCWQRLFHNKTRWLSFLWC